MSGSSVDGSWWPRLLHPLATEDPIAADEVVVAEIGRPWGQDSYRHMYTALAEPEDVARLLTQEGFGGHDVSANGPHPSSQAGDYEPMFWVWGGSYDRLEPLILAWSTAGDTVLAIDPGFLMTYGLVPRLVGGDTQEVHWDDPSGPEPNVAVVRPVSKYFYELRQTASATVRRTYLQDYATQRGKTMVQVFFAEVRGEETADVAAALQDQSNRRVELPGRTVDVRRVTHGGDAVLAQVWGIRHLLDPRDSPIIEGRWNYGVLEWPGINEPVGKVEAHASLDGHVYVRDTVLGAFEGRPGFDINPAMGAVSYLGQWGVGHAERYARDGIAVDLKKLYEGNPPDIVHHYHRYAIDPPRTPWYELASDPNVASRSERITWALCRLGEEIAFVVSAVLGGYSAGIDVVGLDREELEYRGWWTHDVVEPVTRHIAIDITEDEFLDRCRDLSSLVVDRLKEGLIRRVLHGIGVPPSDIEDHRSLKLLQRLVGLCLMSGASGLDLTAEGPAVVERYSEPGEEDPVAPLLVLRDLRTLISHRADRARRLRQALDYFSIDRASTASGWGHAADIVYDGVGEALEKSSDAIGRAILGT